MMQENYTNSKSKIAIIEIILAAILLIILISVFGCSSANKIPSENLNKNEKVLIFTDDENSKWEIKFFNDEIAEAYKNGKQLTPSQIDENEKVIYDKVEEISKNSASEEISMNIDLDGLSESMEILRNNLKDLDIEINIDKEELKNNLRKLKEELKDHKIKINKEVKDELKRLKIEIEDADSTKKKIHIYYNGDNSKASKKIENIRIKTNNKFDEDELVKKIEAKVRKNLKEIKIDLSELEEENGELKLHIERLNKDNERIEKDIKINIDEIKELSAFVKKVKSELVSDNLLNSNDDEITVKFEEDELEINGKKVPENLQDKYRKMIKEHLKENHKRDFSFHIHK